MWNELEDVILREVEADRVPGLCIALVRGGETVHEASYGSADLERGVPRRLLTHTAGLPVR